MAEYTPSARLRGAPSGKLVVISASAVGAITAPPTPCTALAVSSHAWLVANPPNSEAAENSSSPKTNTRRRPRMSPVRPPSRSRPPKVTAYAFTTPLQAAAGKAKRLLDVRQGNVHDGGVEHDHELGGGDDDQGQAGAAVAAAGCDAG